MQRERIKKATIFSLIGNIFLMFAKFFVGIIFKSNGMIADATNSAGDILASVLSFFGNKLSTAPADEDHNVGHGKNEYIFSLFIGISMIIASIIVIKNCVSNLFNNNIAIEFSYLLLIVCVLTIVVKLTLYIYTKKLYKKRKNILLKSLYEDHRNDMFITTGSAVGIILSLYNIYWVDSVVGILISLWITFVGFKIMLDSYNILVDSSIGEDDEQKIRNIVYNFSDEIQMGKMASIPIGDTYIIILTIYVDGKMTVSNSHKITKALTTKIKQKIRNVDRVVIHVNPIE